MNNKIIYQAELVLLYMVLLAKFQPDVLNPLILLLYAGVCCIACFSLFLS